MRATKDVNIKLGTYKNISASRQNIKNLIGNFWAIHVRVMHANFQASSLIGVGGEWGDRPFLNGSLYKISKLPPCFAQEG